VGRMGSNPIPGAQFFSLTRYVIRRVHLNN